jgi:hypothetical protein
MNNSTGHGYPRRGYTHSRSELIERGHRDVTVRVDGDAVRGQPADDLRVGRRQALPLQPDCARIRHQLHAHAAPQADVGLPPLARRRVGDAEGELDQVVRQLA